MLLAMQQGLNSQKEEVFQKHGAGSEMVPRLGKFQVEKKLIVSSSPRCDAPQPSAQRFTRPIVNPKDQSTQTTPQTKEFLQAPKISPQPATASVKHDLPQPTKKLIRKHVVNPKDVCTQTETDYGLTFLKSEPPQAKLRTTAKAPLKPEARCPVKTSYPPATNIKVSSQPESKLSYRPVFHPESESNYRCALHKEMEAAQRSSLSPGAMPPHRGSLSADNDSRRSSLQKGSDPIPRGFLPTDPELRKSSLQTGRPLDQSGYLQKENWSAYKPAFHPESESEYRCPLHLAMEASHPHTFSPGSETPHRGLLPRETKTALGIIPEQREESLSKVGLPSKNMSVQTELFSPVSPCMEVMPVVRRSPWPNADANFWTSPHTEVAFLPGTLPPRSLAKFGPQSPWWPLLQTDAPPPTPQRMSKKATIPLTLDWISEPSNSPLAAEWMWPKPSRPLALEWMQSDLSSPPPSEITSCKLSNPPIADMMGRMSTSPSQPPEETEGKLGSPASDSSWTALPVSYREVPYLPERPEQPPRGADPGQEGRRLKCAGPSHETEDPNKLRRRKSIPRFSAFFVDVSDEMYTDVLWWLKGAVEFPVCLKKSPNKSLDQDSDYHV
uniref:Uncharacterized protein n=1 Tax=Sphaerodactylus townsendi TaxID=933632 RepID=A0ACB8ED86_9SAUR